MKYYIHYSGAMEPTRNSLFDGLENVVIAGNDRFYEVSFNHIDLALTIAPERLEPSTEIVYDIRANRAVFNELPGGGTGHYYNFEGTHQHINRISRQNLRRILEQINSPVLTDDDLNPIYEHLTENYPELRIIRLYGSIRVTFENSIRILITIPENYYTIVSSIPLITDTNDISLLGRRNTLYLQSSDLVINAILEIHSLPDPNDVLSQQLSPVSVEPKTLIRNAESLDSKLKEIKEEMIKSEFVKEIQDKPELIEKFEKFIEESMLNIENKFIEIGLRCPVCLDNMKNVALVPCGHRICSICYAGLTINGIRIVCPECRTESQNKIDLYGGK